MKILLLSYAKPNILQNYVFYLQTAVYIDWSTIYSLQILSLKATILLSVHIIFPYISNHTYFSYGD